MKALAVQKALRAALINEASITMLVGDRLYDAPPEAPAFPFMTVGDIQTQPGDSKTGRGMEHVVIVNTWSRTSRVECRTVMEHIYDRLHDQTLPLDDGYRMDVHLISESTLIEPDKQTFRGMARYRVCVAPIS